MQDTQKELEPKPITRKIAVAIHPCLDEGGNFRETEIQQELDDPRYDMTYVVKGGLTGGVPWGQNLYVHAKTTIESPSTDAEGNTTPDIPYIILNPEELLDSAKSVSNLEITLMGGEAYVTAEDNRSGCYYQAFRDLADWWVSLECSLMKMTINIPYDTLFTYGEIVDVRSNIGTFKETYNDVNAVPDYGQNEAVFVFKRGENTPK